MRVENLLDTASSKSWNSSPASLRVNTELSRISHLSGESPEVTDSFRSKVLPVAVQSRGIWLDCTSYSLCSGLCPTNSNIADTKLYGVKFNIYRTHMTIVATSVQNLITEYSLTWIEFLSCYTIYGIVASYVAAFGMYINLSTSEVYVLCCELAILDNDCERTIAVRNRVARGNTHMAAVGWGRGSWAVWVFQVLNYCCLKCRR
jgi:hypothetical protein